MNMKTNFTLPSRGVDTVGACDANQITKEYYNFLVGNINNGIIRKAVCAVYYERYNYTTYHLISR